MEQDYYSWIPILSLVVAALAVFVGPIISYRIAKLTNETNIYVSNKQIVAPIRQKWINELRILLSDISGKCEYYWEQGIEDDENIYGLIQSFKAKTHTLELYLNPKEDDHSELLNAVNEMVHLITSGQYDDSTLEKHTEFIQKHDKVMSLSKEILKREWEVVKSKI